MAAPETLTIDGFQDNRVLIGGQPYDVLPKGALEGFTPGGQFKGWLNPQGQYGPYVKVADKQNGAQAQPQSAPAASSQTGFPPPDPQPQDAKDRSIERQVAAKCAARILAGRTEPEAPDKYAERVHFLVDTFASAIRGN